MSGTHEAASTTIANVPTIAEAQRLYRQKDYEASNAILFALNRKNGESSYRLFMIGRNYRGLKDADKSVAFMERAIAARDPHPPAFFEVGSICAARGDVVPAAKMMIRFLEGSRQVLTAPQPDQVQIRAVLALAHRCFPLDRPTANLLYEQLEASGLADYLGRLRVIESFLASSAPDALTEADARMDRLRAQVKFDAWGHLADSRLQQRMQRPERAFEAVMQAFAAAPRDLLVRRFACQRLLELGRIEEGAREVERLAADAASADQTTRNIVAGLQLRVLIAGGQPEQVTACLTAPGFDVRAIEDAVLAEALSRFAQPGDQITAAERAASVAVAAILAERRPYSMAAAQSLLNFHIRRREWAAAEALFAAIAGSDVAEHPNLIIRRFELLCLSGRLQEARVYYDAQFRGRALTPWAASLCMRFLAEVEAWIEASEIANTLIEQRVTLQQGNLLLLQVARRSGRREGMLRRLDAALASGRAPEHYAELQALLVDDLCVLAGDDRVIFDGTERTISQGNALLIKPVAELALAASDTVAFLCVDRAYFLSLVVFLASYSSNNPGHATQGQWYVFLDADVPPAFAEILRRVSRTLGLSVTIVAEHEFVPAGVEHRDGYGIFTGGVSLSRAAFFRIYAARYLLWRGAWQRALYVDTDIICQRDLTDLMTLPFDGALLLARYEDQTPEVADAANRNGVDPARYFNSGVLLMDFANPDTARALDEAIRLAEQEAERLTFHDQCALNVAFAGHTRGLEAAHNHFVRPYRQDNGEPAASSLVHFLARPKPWDPAYQRPEYRELYTPYLAIVRDIVDAADYRDMVAASIDGAAHLRPARAAPAAASPRPLFRLDNILPARLTLSSGAVLDVPPVGTSHPSHPPRFVISIRKSGSTMVSRAAALLAEELGLGFIDIGALIFYGNMPAETLWEDAAVNRLLHPGVIYAGFRDYPLVMEHSPLFRAAPKVMFLRDPRDALVSEYFSNAYSHSVPEGDKDGGNVELIGELRSKALHSDIDAYVLNRTWDFTRTARTFYPALRRGDTVMQYEDFVLDKHKLVSTLCRHLRLDAPEAVIARVAREIDSRPQVEDPRAFVRKVTPGDHREKLAPETIAQLNETLAPVMTAFGYAG